MQGIEELLQLDDVQLLHQVLDQLLARPLLPVDEALHELLLAQEIGYALQALLRVGLELFVFGHGRGGRAPQARRFEDLKQSKRSSRANERRFTGILGARTTNGEWNPRRQPPQCALRRRARVHRRLQWPHAMSAVLNKKLKRAHDHLRQGDAARARALCQEVLRDAPRNPDALYLFGLTQLAEGRAQDAVAPLERVLAADPRHAPALEHLGLAHLMLGQFAEAETALSAAAALPRAPASALMRWGIAVLEQGRAAEAVPVLRRALALQPEDTTCRVNLGRALALAGDVAAARAEFEAVLKLAPGHPDAMFNLGVMSLGQDDLDDAGRWFERVVSESPGSADAHVNLGIVRQREGRLDEALACFRRALALDPGFAAAGANLAAALIALGRNPEAVAQLRENLRRNENDGWTWGTLADALFQTGELDEAARAAARARALDAALSRLLLGARAGSYGARRDRGGHSHAARRVRAHRRGRVAGHARAPVAADLRLAGVARRLGRGGAPPGSRGGPGKPVLAAARGDDRRATARLHPALGRRELRRAPRQQAGSGAWKPGRPTRGPAAQATRARVRVGYLSSEFHEHAIAHLLAGVLEAHDRAHFEIYAYSYGPEDASPMRARLNQACEHFVDIAREPDDTAARRIEEDALDILVDLKGYTMGGAHRDTRPPPLPGAGELARLPRDHGRALHRLADRR